MIFFKDDASRVIDLDTFRAIENDLVLKIESGLGSGDGNDVTSKGPTDNQPYQPGFRVTWTSLVVNRPSEVCRTCSGCIIWTQDRLTYAPAVELHCLGEMVELDVELVNMVLIGACVGGGIKHTSELKVLNIKWPCKALMPTNGMMRFNTKTHNLISIIHILPL
jgi:hypothetical protein